MSAPLFFAPPASLDGAGVGQIIRLEGAEGRHAATVQRLEQGESVQLADGSGRLAATEVVQVDADALDLRVVSIEEHPPAEPRMTLVQALAKGERDLLAIEMATELGVDEIVPWQAERSIVRWRGERAAKAHRKWESALVAASKQARRPRVPALSPLVDRAALVNRVAAAEVALVLHEAATEPLTDIVLPATGEVLVVVGPEGGVSDNELAAMTAAGAAVVRLGPAVLRTSTAGSAALAVLSAATRWR